MIKGQNTYVLVFVVDGDFEATKFPSFIIENNQPEHSFLSNDQKNY